MLKYLVELNLDHIIVDFAMLAKIASSSTYIVSSLNSSEPGIFHALIRESLSPPSALPRPQRCIINNTHRLVELCVAKLSQDWFPLLELLAMATNPHCKFHIYNGTRPSETVPAGAQLTDDELYARPPDPRSPKVNGTPSPLNPSRQKSLFFGFYL